MWKIWAWWCMLVIPMLVKQGLTGQTAQSTYQLHTSERCLRIQVVSIWGSDTWSCPFTFLHMSAHMYMHPNIRVPVHTWRTHIQKFYFWMSFVTRIYILGFYALGPLSLPQAWTTEEHFYNVGAGWGKHMNQLRNKDSITKQLPCSTLGSARTTVS